MKTYFVPGARTLTQFSTRLMIDLAPCFDFKFWSSDVKFEYLQSTEPFTRRVFVKNTAAEFRFRERQFLELLKDLFSFADAGYLWEIKLKKHFTDNIGLTPTKTDQSFSSCFGHEKLMCTTETVVNDFLWAATKEFEEKFQSTHESFKRSGAEAPPFKFAGFRITSNSKIPYTTDQNFYLAKLEELEQSSSFSSCCSMKTKVFLLINTQPGLPFEISQLLQFNRKFRFRFQGVHQEVEKHGTIWQK